MADGIFRDQRFLNPIPDVMGRTVLIQGSPAPVFRGPEEPERFDYVCGVCRNQTIGESIRDSQLVDLAFHRLACGGLSTTEPLPPGMPIPTRRCAPMSTWQQSTSRNFNAAIASSG